MRNQRTLLKLQTSLQVVRKDYTERYTHESSAYTMPLWLSIFFSASISYGIAGIAFRVYVQCSFRMVGFLWLH